MTITPKFLGLSTSYFAAKGLSIYGSVKRAYDLGFRLIELGANHTYEKGWARILKRISTDFSNVTFTQHCYFPPVFKEEFFSNPAEGLTPNNKKVLDAIFATAKILKSKIVSFHNGFNNKYAYEGEFMQFSGFKKFKIIGTIPADVALSGFKDFVKYALEKSHQQDVKVAVENVVAKTFSTQCTLNSLAAFQDFLEEFPELNFLLDFGHAFIEYPNHFEFFSLREKIIEMHLDDVTEEKLDHRVLGNGVLNLDKLFLEIKKLPKMPILILEHSAEVGEEEIKKEIKLVEKYLSEC